MLMNLVIVKMMLLKMWCMSMGMATAMLFMTKMVVVVISAMVDDDHEDDDED